MGITIKGIKPLKHTVQFRSNIPPTWITSESLGDFSAGVSHTYILSATDTENKTVSYRVVSGTLPPGMSLSGDGTISGSSDILGTYEFTIRASDGFGYRDKTFAIRITNDTPVWQTSGGSIGTWENGVSNSFIFSATDPNNDPVSFSLVSGSLPEGLVLASDGTLSGTPTNSGTYTFVIRASDDRGGYTDRSFDITVNTVEQLADYYVDFISGSDSNPGTREAPFKTLRQASIYVPNNGSVSILQKEYQIDLAGGPTGRYVWDGIRSSGKTFTVYGNNALLNLNTGNKYECIFAFWGVSNNNVIVEGLNFICLGAGNNPSGNAALWENGTADSSGRLGTQTYHSNGSNTVVMKNCHYWSDYRPAYFYMNSNGAMCKGDGGEAYVALRLTYINYGSYQFLNGFKSNKSATGVSVVSKPTLTQFRNSIGY